MSVNNSGKVLLYLYRDYLKRSENNLDEDSARHFNEEYKVLKELNLNLNPIQFHVALKNLSEEGFLHTPKDTSDGFPEFSLTDHAIDSLNQKFNGGFDDIDTIVNSLDE
ncbi:hypothetical protein BU103_10975 [Staphylococcus xylosus]|uniref:hypothetical protein n=1 Tax=Staphylococcus pseudoxylosus TaxID=2282419 RepID=UPI000D1DE95F|nr:hypothetical protein [Staphylococcus pseudoxylosus]PTI57027.1 hypothetical protein BU103_10975 [Staphylococcus xylosus]